MTRSQIATMVLVAQFAVNLIVPSIQAEEFFDFEPILEPSFALGDAKEGELTEDFTSFEYLFNDNDNSADPSMSGDGQHVAFDSSADLTGENPEYIRQVFVINSNGDPDSLRQVSSDFGFSSNDPSLSGDGSRVAFESSSNVLGDNPNNITQIFVGTSDGDPTDLKQLTDDKRWHSLNPSMSGDGRWVAFESRGNLTGQNTENQSHIFVVNSDKGKIFQLTLDPLFISSHASISADGSRIAFESKHDDGKSQSQIFTIKKNGSALRAVTINVNVASSHPSLSDDGLIVAFQAESDLRGASDVKPQYIYVAKADGSDLIQIARGEGASISGDGSRVAFETADHFVGVMNADGSGELTEFRQIPFSADPSISADGGLLVFEGDSDDHSYQIFIFEVDGEETKENVSEDDAIPGSQDLPSGPDASRASYPTQNVGEALL